MTDNKKIVVCSERYNDILSQKNSDPRVVFRGPAAMGDIWGLIRQDVSTVIIIDCSHSGGASAWHREIIDALHAGITIIGAGGTGALRAVELAGSAILGVGWVHEQYLKGELESDDELLDSTDGLALVDVRFALDGLLAQNKLSRQKQKSILAEMKALHYTKRTQQNLLKILDNHQVDGSEGLSPPLNIRLRDAHAAMDLAFHPPGGHDTTVTVEKTVTSHPWQWFRTSNMHLSFVFPEGVVRGYEIFGVLEKRVGKKYFHALSEEFFTHQWLKEHALNCPPPYLENSLNKSSHLFHDDEFLLTNGLTSHELEQLFLASATIQWAKKNRVQLLSRYHGKTVENYAHAWGIEHGIRFPADQKAATWIIDKGPEYFGFNWVYSAALMKKLQLEGDVAGYAKHCLVTSGVAAGETGRGDHV